ncbi:sodium- and chloride-dependent glycine transporter 1-like [Haliotis cracherodii]|uniref:sodium- and chloride-dependent glycine transporter 1-like n=1 Tax=Haliotis cracherodii TaxID=6455 RepID=UPI0039EBD9E5
MPQERWSRHLDYIVTMLGSSIGSGSFTKFPYFCMRNGGGAYLIVFAFFTIIAAIPCVFLEMVVGQFSQGGLIKVWNLCPPFKGIGVGIVVSTWLFYSYYNVIFSWFLFYGYSSFSSTLPWSHCDNPWNTPACVSGASVVNTTYPNITDLPANLIDGTVNLTDSVVRMTATEEFWKFNVLEMTDGLDDLGRIRWPLAGCLLCTHLIVYLCVFRGIKVSGKIAYITVSMPYILVTTFLVRGCLLPGAVDGIYFYIYPQFQKLLEPKIWIEACSFSLYSMSIAMGYIITLSGHNKSNNNCFRDAVVVCVVDSLSTVFIGFAFFAIVGHVAFKSGVAVEAFESSGFNLAFIVFPEILTYLPLPQLWSVLTFVMLMTLHIDTMVPTVEILMEAFGDLFPNIQRWRFLAIGGILLSSFLMGIVYITQGGIYVLTLVDWFAYFPSLALYAMLECVVVGWCYGTQKLQDDILIMWGRSTPRVIMTAIRFICPVLLTIIYCNSLYSYRPPKYGDYDYPTWATRVGWLISSVSILPFPAVFLWTVYNTPGNTLKEKLRTSLKPNRRWHRPSPESALSDVPLEQASEDEQ